MSKISTNTEINIDEVEQKTLLTICTTNYIDVIGLPYIFECSPKNFFENSTALLLPSSLYYLCEGRGQL